MKAALTTFIFMAATLFSEPSYLITEECPPYESLVQIFDQGRVTVDCKTFNSYGFNIHDKRHGGILIASHPDLEGYLLKLVVDYKYETQSRELKACRGNDEWIEFSGRCRRRALIQDYIESNNLSHISVPEKWLFRIPDKFSPPRTGAYLKKKYLLIAEKMPIPPETENRKLWFDAMTEEILDELYVLVKDLNLFDIGPNNLYFLDADHVVLIDTKEWKTEANSLKSIPRYLNLKMRNYWKSLNTSSTKK